MRPRPDIGPSELPDNPHHRVLRLAGFAAATVFLLVSGLANLRFGLSLGSTEVDRAIYAIAITGEGGTVFASRKVGFAALSDHLSPKPTSHRHVPVQFHDRQPEPEA